MPSTHCVSLRNFCGWDWHNSKQFPWRYSLLTKKKRKKAWKNPGLTGIEPMTSAIPVLCSTMQLNYQANSRELIVLWVHDEPVRDSHVWLTYVYRHSLIAQLVEQTRKHYEKIFFAMFVLLYCAGFYTTPLTARKLCSAALNSVSNWDELKKS